MEGISNKISTLRSATAQAIVKVSQQETIDAILNKTVPKGDVLERAKTAGLFSVKRTADMIPDCHPIPIEYTQVEFEINGVEIIITVNVKTTYKTGGEVEAMHGASVVALTIYDMLKTIDKEIEISGIKLLGKKGGQTDFGKRANLKITAAIVVVSDAVSAGKKKDTAGKAIIESLNQHGIESDNYMIIPDEPEEIKQVLKNYCDQGIDLVITVGGTGFAPRDKTPETLKSIIEMEIPGIMEAARNYGQQRTPYAMLSRGVAGLRGKSLILALPGSTRGAAETMDALFPYVLHIFRVLSFVSENDAH